MPEQAFNFARQEWVTHQKHNLQSFCCQSCWLSYGAQRHLEGLFKRPNLRIKTRARADIIFLSRFSALSLHHLFHITQRSTK